jgi:hypothetical protein
MDTDSQTFQIHGKFPMHRGGFLDSPTIAFETWGELQGKGDNAVLLFTGLSPSAHAASSPENPAPGWWEDMIGSGLPLDTDRLSGFDTGRRCGWRLRGDQAPGPGENPHNHRLFHGWYERPGVLRASSGD